MKYIDTSAFVKFYADESFEKGAEKVRSLVEQAKTGKAVLTSSILLIGETISVFDRWLRMNAITLEQRDKLVARFFTDINELIEAEGLSFDQVNTFSIMQCIEIILTHHLSINDAIHLWSVLSRQDTITEFICSDIHLLKAVKSEQLNAWNPED